MKATRQVRHMPGAIGRRRVGGGSIMRERGDEAPEVARDCMAVLGGARTGRCRVLRASSVSERVRCLPSSDVGNRIVVAGTLSRPPERGASCRRCAKLIGASAEMLTFAQHRM